MLLEWFLRKERIENQESAERKRKEEQNRMTSKRDERRREGQREGSVQKAKGMGARRRENHSLCMAKQLFWLSLFPLTRKIMRHARIAFHFLSRKNAAALLLFIFSDLPLFVSSLWFISIEIDNRKKTAGV
jgi:hypothetical protein